MATTFKIKRKYFAESDQNKGMSTAGKVATGVGAAAGTAALAFAGARRGVFGGQMAMKANNAYISAGKRLMQSKSATISGMGSGMIQSGAERWAAGSAQLKNKVAQNAGKAAMSEKAQEDYIKRKTADKLRSVGNTLDKQKLAGSGAGRAASLL